MSGKKTKCDIRMYKMGTGDCFVLKFFGDEPNDVPYKLMIDCGTIGGSGAKMSKFVNDLCTYTNGEVDTLLITHEHQDHIVGFSGCKKIFKEKFKTKELWLAWTEDPKDSLARKWKKSYGQKKTALHLATSKLVDQRAQPLFSKIYTTNNSLKGKTNDKELKAKNDFIDTLKSYTELNVDEGILGAKDYIGDQKGMKAIKDKSITKYSKVKYLNPGDIFENISGLENVRIHVLGPPRDWRKVKKEHGTEEESYEHNEHLDYVNGLSSLPLTDSIQFGGRDAPFNEAHVHEDKEEAFVATEYVSSNNAWRRIDYDWLFSAGSLSLRLTKAINNLSVVIAIEFIDSGKVMLFPGDAELGSWESWHKIKWDKKGRDEDKHLTEDLLNRTVFYKIAHHISHNGTAKEDGLELMNHPDLVAMGPLSYRDGDDTQIRSGWMNTMPNRGIMRDLLKKTKGRVMMMSTVDMFEDKAKSVKLDKAIKDARNAMTSAEAKDFKSKTKDTNLFVQYTVDAS